MRTSEGSPYFEYTRALACVYPYGPDFHLLHVSGADLGVKAPRRAGAELQVARRVRAVDIIRSMGVGGGGS